MMAQLPAATDFTEAPTQGSLKTALTELITFLAAAVGTDSSGGAATGTKNLLINGALKVNQRGCAGGALAAGAYGFDRWKAGSGGCTVSVASDVITLTGPLVQVIEAPDLAGQQVTISVEDPSGSILVTVAGVSGYIYSGSGRRSVTLTIPGGSTGNISVTIEPSTAGARTFRRMQLERGPAGTTYERRPLAVELAMCQRYCNQIPGMLAGAAASASVIDLMVPTPSMRAAPTAVLTTSSISMRVLGSTSSYGISLSGTIAETTGTALYLSKTSGSALVAGTPLMVVDGGSIGYLSAEL